LNKYHVKKYKSFSVEQGQYILLKTCNGIMWCRCKPTNTRKLETTKVCDLK